MSELTDALKSGYEIYKSAKKVRKSLKATDKVANSELAKLSRHTTQLSKILADLPAQVSRTEGRAVIGRTRTLVKERLKAQSYPDDLDEVSRLNTQLAILSLAEAKLALALAFEVRDLASSKKLEVLASDLKEVQKQINTQMKVQGFYRVSIRSVVFTIDVGLLVAKTLL